MSDMHAYRNIKLCTKDCLCLYVCPVYATDTETGQIDFEKCIGCGMCSKACPSHAITMVPNKYPVQQKKDEKIVNELFKIAKNKIEEIKKLTYMLEKTKEDSQIKLLKALIHSNKVVIEDLYREAGYMLPQSKNTRELLEILLKKDDDLDKDIIKKLINNIEVNE